MKKTELIIVLFVGVLLGAGIVYYYKNNPNIEVKKEQINQQQEKNIKLSKETEKQLADLEVQFKNFAQGKTYTQLIKDKDYQNWVKQVNNLLEENKKQGNKDIVNYIYYDYSVKVVMKYLHSYTDLEKDLVIQSIRRIDFNTLSDKNYYTQLMKDYVDVKYYKPIIENIDKIDAKKLDTDKQYFGKVMLGTTTGIFYSIFKNRYDWNKTGIGFKPEFLENQFVDYLSQRFEQILAKLGYNKQWFEKKVFEYYNINSLKELAELLKKDYENIKTKYNIEKLGIPTDRFFRMDERRALFNKDGLHTQLYKTLKEKGKLEDFKKDIKEFRLKMYLISYLGKDMNLFNHKVRAKFINAEEGGGIQNVFRVGRYVDEVMKLDLKPQAK